MQKVVESALPGLQRDPVAGATVPKRIPSLLVAAVMRAAEWFVLALAGLVNAGLWVGFEDAFSNGRYVSAAIVTALAAVIIMQRREMYTTTALTAPLRQAPRVVIAWINALALLVAAVFMLKVGVDFSRGWLLLWFFTGIGASLALRAGASVLIGEWAREGRLNRRTVVYGAGAEGEALLRALQSDPDSDVAICGIFDDRGLDRIAHGVCGVPVLGTADKLVDYCRQTDVDLLIVSIPVTAETRLLQILKKLWVLPVDIRLAAHANKLRFRPRAYSFVGKVPLLDLFDKPIAEWDSLVKSAFDKVVAVLALIVLSPVMLATALAVKLDSKGPVFFRQKRLGFNNQVIEVLKFRSMHTGQLDANATKLVTRDDPRVTRVGRIIRKTSLDELPQLFNVLTGTLSLVGPRPHAMQAKAADKLYHDVADGYFARHRVKPGITGWAQIHGWRGETDTIEKLTKRVEHDLYYIDNWSLTLDLFILAKTPFALLKSENAY